MDPSSPFLSPGFLVTAAIAFIGFVAWLLRLEAKVNGGEKEMIRLNLSLEDTWKDLEQHRTNSDVHFSQKLATAVEQRQADRFGRLEGDLQEIKAIVKELAKR